MSLNDQYICHTNSIYKTNLEHRSSFKLWYQNSANISIHCYYWCHNNVAAIFWNTSHDTDLLIEIVSMYFHVLHSYLKNYIDQFMIYLEHLLT